MDDFKVFNETMATIYANYYLKHGEMKALDFVLGNTVSVYVLNTLYEIFIKDGIETIEQIPQDKKDKYWQTACVYFTEQSDRIKGCKSFYIMELITGIFSYTENANNSN